MAARPELLIGERQERESKKAIQACNDYLRMGPGRSMAKLIARYQADTEVLPPTRRLGTLKTWSIRFGWQNRASAYDAQVEMEKTQAIEARRREAMETGLALDYERVMRLKQLADGLIDEIWDGDGLVEDKIWLPDVKQVGGGESVERVDIVRFNQALLSEFRAALDDLAKETGGRKQQLGLSGPDGGPIEFNPFAGLSDDDLNVELERMEQRRKRALSAPEQGEGAPAAGDAAEPDPAGEIEPTDA